MDASRVAGNSRTKYQANKRVSDWPLLRDRRCCLERPLLARERRFPAELPDQAVMTQIDPQRSLANDRYPAPKSFTSPSALDA
jgi:hypothetical protein